MKSSTFLTAIALGISMSAMAVTQNDAQITKVVETTNKGEIELAKLAKDKTANKEVKAFADHMIMDHSANNKKTQEFMKKNKMTMEESPESREMMKTNESTMTAMKKLNGKEFDQAYINNQINAHETVLKKFDTEFIPNAKNQELKSMLQATRSKVETHLNHAKELKTSL